MYSIL
jgi:hypothetical protein